MARTLVGYAVKWDAISQDLGGFTETVKRGAFAKALRERQDTIARVEHDSRLLLGRVSAGTLRLSEDALGLRYEVDIADVRVATDAWEQANAGNLFQSSFAFTVPEDGDDWIVLPSGLLHRTILQVERLVDVSPVAQAAYPSSTVSARADEDDDLTIGELFAGRRGVMPLAAQHEIDRLRVGLA